MHCIDSFRNNKYNFNYIICLHSKQKHRKETAVDWLVEQYEKAFTLKVNNVMTSIIEQAKEMEQEQMATNCNQLEISDEEIEDRAAEWMEEDWDLKTYYEAFIDGANWYREKLKERTCR